MKRVMGFGLLLVMATGAVAAERHVLFEDFTATWCGPCVITGQALRALQDAHPGNVVVLQPHVSDIYALSWGTTRVANYGNSGYIPNVWVEGTQQYVGSGYAGAYESIFQTCLTAPTDVDLAVGAVNTGGQTFKVTVQVKLEAGGTAKTVRVYTLRALDHYPQTGNHNVNCLMEAAAFYNDIPLTPGQTSTFVKTFTFDAVSWQYQSDMRIIVIAQQPGTAGPRPVYNSRMIRYPFPALGLKGDLNCDTKVDFFDINPFVLALSDPAGYAAAYPTCDIMNGDCNEDGKVDFVDINAFVAKLTNP